MKFVRRKTIPALAAVTTLATSGQASTAAEAQLDPSRPNVVMFFVDDLGWADNNLDFANAFAAQRGDTDAFFETPALRQMADAGRLFSQAYSSSPVCSPTRASLLTGQAVSRHNTTQYIGGPSGPAPYDGWFDGFYTTAHNLRDQRGYTTGYAGKFHLGGGNRPEWHGFDENFGGGGQALPPTWFADGGGGFDWANGLPDDGPQYAGEYLTDRLTRDSVDFIERSVANNEPFYLQLSHYGVHVPFAAPTDLVDKYANKVFNGNYTQFNGLTDSQKMEVAIYAAMTESVDQSLGAIRQTLANQGVADNTILIFHSDNGGLATPSFGNFATDDMNAPLRNGKGNLYEGGIRVPLLIEGPGVAQGIDGTPVVTHDLHPTILTAAGAPLFEDFQPIDGAALNDTLAGGPGPDRGDKPIVIHYPHYSGQAGRPGGTIIEGDWKLIQSYETGGLELYNLADDLGETNNLAGVETERAESLRVKMHQFLVDTDAQVPSNFTLSPFTLGDPIELTNPSFEADDVADGGIGGLPAGWSWVGGVAPANAGTVDPDNTGDGPNFFGSDGDGVNGTMDGPQLFSLDSLVDESGADITNQVVGIEQELALALVEEANYVIRVSAGVPNGKSRNNGALIRVLAGETVVASYTPDIGFIGLMQDFEFGFEAHADLAPYFGDALTLQIVRNGGDGSVNFDDVRVFSTAPLVIPEPTAMIGLGGLTLAAWRRRRA
ncbi:MAG: sulfatase [Planctomycetota bacterium]